MIIWLNDYGLNVPGSRVYVNEPLEGLDKPGVRTSRGTNTGQHGGYIGAQQYEARSVAITGSIFSSDVSEALQKRREIQSRLPIHPEVITVRIQDDDGSMYTFKAYLISFKMDINQARMKSIFKIELEAPDPVIYDDAAGAALDARVNQVIPGGFLFSSASPVFGGTFFFSAGSDSTTIDNTSEVQSYPIITIEGKITDPVFTNRTAGKSFKLEGYGVDASAVTVIDMGERTVTLNGGNVFAYVAEDSDWWTLAPGENEIEFTSGSGGDVKNAGLSWRPGYWGI